MWANLILIIRGKGRVFVGRLPEFYILGFIFDIFYIKVK